MILIQVTPNGISHIFSFQLLEIVFKGVIHTYKNKKTSNTINYEVY